MSVVLENGWMETANWLVIKVHTQNKYMTSNLLFLYPAQMAENQTECCKIMLHLKHQQKRHNSHPRVCVLRLLRQLNALNNKICQSAHMQKLLPL